MSRSRGLVNSPAGAFIRGACRCEGRSAGEEGNDGRIAACAEAPSSVWMRGRSVGEGTRERDSHYQFSSNGSAAP